MPNRNQDNKPNTPQRNFQENENGGRDNRRNHQQDNTTPNRNRGNDRSNERSNERSNRSDNNNHRTPNQRSGGQRSQGRSGGSGRKQSRDRYTAFLDKAVVERGITEKTLFQGGLRINAHNRRDAYATTDGIVLDVYIDGQTHRNRALEGDIVVVELYLDVEKWKVLKDAKEEVNEEILVEDNKVIHLQWL